MLRKIITSEKCSICGKTATINVIETARKSIWYCGDHNIKFWIYLKNHSNKLRVFDFKHGRYEIAIQCESIEDANKVKKILIKAGHTDIKIGESFTTLTWINHRMCRFKSCS